MLIYSERQLAALDTLLRADKLDEALRRQMAENREEIGKNLDRLRTELQDSLRKNMQDTGQMQRERFSDMAKQQEKLLSSTEKRLDDMRNMVEEKLQKTLNERIGQSFELVRKQLESVQAGLGEMKTLA
ncbi:MAG: hypothetical protein LBM61_03595, partial [Prevotellaceae bacterium]|nr:hypothetical protein [Prevotellaceae bacterium]